MDMRVSFQTLVNDALINTQQQTQQLTKLQEQASTGLRIVQPSDDPAAAERVLAAQAEQDRLDTYLSNIGTTQSTLNTSVSSLQNADGILSQAKSIALQGANSTNDASSLEALAQQVDQLIARMLDLGNTQQNGEYIYGGTATQNPPFVVTGTDSQGRPTGIAYQGSGDSTQIAVSSTQSVTTNTPGSQVFGGDSSGAFQALIKLRDDLRNNAGVPQTQQLQAISQDAAGIDTADQTVLQTVGKQSAQLQTLSDLQTSTQNMKLSTQEYISGLQSADITQVAVSLQAAQNQYQLTLLTTARMFDQSLADFLK